MSDAEAELRRALLLLETPPPAISQAEAADAALRHYGLVGDITPLSGERDRNFLLRPPGSQALVLKFSNQEEDEAVLAFQIALLRHVERERPALAAPRLRATLAGPDVATVSTAAGAEVALHAVTFLPGVCAQGVASTEAMRRNIGRALGELAQALATFRHPGADRVLLWDIMRAPGLRPVLSCVQDGTRRSFIQRFLDRFETDLAPRLAPLRRQVIHNDLSASNLMLASTESHVVTGILDFGDAVFAPMVNDLAVAASYHLQLGERPLDAVAGMVAAYEAVTPLQDEERAMLPDLILARLVIRTVINEWRGARFPENRTYIERNMRQAWTLLDQFMAMPDASRRDMAAQSFQHRRIS
ncbi:phosphotransferase [Labrys monachus]|uniref:Hydroxylysine kinase n=1 Tax=Labrys monachus TaxID=217067 RepID=A0ABU0FA42_9HYPH|nr:phosphotransferase [Labrys monachus]MDQ0391489.1 Ser/Thr protein kinase RdoA (MazF antagonist) [Labrys monachus]